MGPAPFDPQSALSSLGSVASAMWPLLWVFSYLVGIVLLVRAAILMAVGRDGRGHQDDVPIGQVVAYILIGGCLIQFARSLRNTRELLAGAGSEIRSAMAYAAGSPGSHPLYGLALQTVFLWIAVLGAIAVMRGFYIWRNLASGSNSSGHDDPFFKGLWHIIGGGICVNIGMG